MTFSISARCPRTGWLGIAVSSSSPAVAARCAHARAGAGVVATQNITDPRLGPRGLDLMAAGQTAPDALARLREAPNSEYRQLALVDCDGGAAVFTGARALGVTGALTGDGVAVAGNLLAHDGVMSAMLAAFAAASDRPLGDRLIAAMRAAVTAGGEAGPVRSAGLLLVSDQAWAVADLRVDWHDAPIEALADLWTLWQPQMQAYVVRALDPGAAPSFGVPGDT